MTAGARAPAVAHGLGIDIEWGGDGAPRSRRFDDIYYSPEDGLAESRATFLEGCALPAAWAGRESFTVAETGFGTGLTIAALVHLWQSAKPVRGRLEVHSVEAFPLTRDAMIRALSNWPELRPVASSMAGAYPADGPGRGVHRLQWAPDLSLTLHVGEVADVLSAAEFRADAWFLDGFAPAKNPAMWHLAVLDRIGRLSRPGARLATFTAAGAVRRGLVAAGFDVHKQSGFGRKRERIVAVYRGRPPG